MQNKIRNWNDAQAAVDVFRGSRPPLAGLLPNQVNQRIASLQQVLSSLRALPCDSLVDDPGFETDDGIKADFLAEVTQLSRIKTDYSDESLSTLATQWSARTLSTTTLATVKDEVESITQLAQDNLEKTSRLQKENERLTLENRVLKAYCDALDAVV